MQSLFIRQRGSRQLKPYLHLSLLLGTNTPVFTLSRGLTTREVSATLQKAENKSWARLSSQRRDGKGLIGAGLTRGCLGGQQARLLLPLNQMLLDPLVQALPKICGSPAAGCSQVKEKQVTLDRATRVYSAQKGRHKRAQPVPQHRQEDWTADYRTPRWRRVPRQSNSVPAPPDHSYPANLWLGRHAVAISVVPEVRQIQSSPVSCDQVA